MSYEKELRKIEEQRADSLKLAGLSEEDAALVGARLDIDIGEARRLAKKGCSAALLLRILE